MPKKIQSLIKNKLKKFSIQNNHLHMNLTTKLIKLQNLTNNAYS